MIISSLLWSTYVCSPYFFLLANLLLANTWLITLPYIDKNLFTQLDEATGFASEEKQRLLQQVIIIIIVTIVFFL
jgi:hypothetical protein